MGWSAGAFIPNPVAMKWAAASSDWCSADAEALIDTY
jgi:hypothetical protein